MTGHLVKHLWLLDSVDDCLARLHDAICNASQSELNIK